MTGGAQGLGLASARAMLEHGLSKLAIFDVDEKCIGEALLHFSGLEDRYVDDVSARIVDVSDENAVNEEVAEVSGVLGGIDILVSFAGITGSKLAVEYPIDEWKKIFDVNLHGSFLIARALAR